MLCTVFLLGPLAHLLFCESHWQCFVKPWQRATAVADLVHCGTSWKLTDKKQRSQVASIGRKKRFGATKCEKLTKLYRKCSLWASKGLRLAYLVFLWRCRAYGESCKSCYFFIVPKEVVMQCCALSRGGQRALHFTLHTSHPMLYTPHSTLHTSHPTLCAPHFTRRTPHSTPPTTDITLQSTHFAFHCLHYTSHSTPCTPSTLHSLKWYRSRFFAGLVSQ